MSQPKNTYKIYRYDAASMNVSADSVEASNHEEAIALVEAMGFGSKCEIWDGRDLVATLNAERAA
ncbi:hypothetical protein [Sphingomonas flavescens]|uniref:hypothetical protein n=1 Tax=Sphingomonas flavescens TaxID=3132797 RepID=UPI002805B683|nr:hypothetical protein [Sphingomonas limnosediminicola]